MFRNKLRHRGKLYKLPIQPAQQLTLNKDLRLKQALMATQRDSKTLHRRLHQQMPLIKRLTPLIKRTTALLSTTIEKLMKRRRLIIHNNLLRMFKVARVLTMVKTPRQQLKRPIQHQEQVFTQHL